MTSPLSSTAYPNDPTGPSAAPEGYHTPGTITPTNTSPMSGEKVGAYRGNFIELILREVVRGLTGVFLPGAGAAFNQLVDWVQSILPGWIREPIITLVELLVDVLDLIPFIGPPVGDALEYFASIFGFMRDKTNTAQSTGDAAQVSADNANVGVARLEGKDAAGDVPGGIYFADTFDRLSTTALGSNYDQASSGAPTGALRTDGNNAWWNVGGNGQGVRFARVTTPLFTIYQGLQVVLDTKIANLNLVDPHVRMLLRCNTARTSYVYVDIRHDLIEVFKVISGSTTSLGSAPLPMASAAGDRWTFKAGTNVSDDEFVVLQNTAEAFRVQDGGTLAGKGTGFEYTGFALVNGQIQVGFGNNVSDPPRVQSVTAYDRLPTN